MSKSSGDTLKVAIEVTGPEIEGNLQDTLFDQLVALGNRHEVRHGIMRGIGRGRAGGAEIHPVGRIRLAGLLVDAAAGGDVHQGDAIRLARQILRRAGTEDRHLAGVCQNHRHRAVVDFVGIAAREHQQSQQEDRETGSGHQA